MSKESTKTLKKIIKNTEFAFNELGGCTTNFCNHGEIIHSLMYAIGEESDRLEKRIKKLEELNNVE